MLRKFEFQSESIPVMDKKDSVTYNGRMRIVFSHFMEVYGKRPFIAILTEHRNNYIFDEMTGRLHEAYPEMKCVSRIEQEFDKSENTYTFSLKYGLEVVISDCSKVKKPVKPGTESHEKIYCFSDLMVFYLPEQIDEVDRIESLLTEAILNSEEKSVRMGMLVHEMLSGFDVSYIDITDSFQKISDFDLHYNQGFEIFYNALIERMRSSRNGIVLFHGLPGTGKTFCIRNMVFDLYNDKKFIYFPAEMFAQVLNPEFITFIINYIAQQKKKDVVLIIEDADYLLLDRQETANSGLANLLNIADGFLNDMLGFQIIATTNLPVDRIDKAIIRSGRLIAQKEFRCLDRQRSEKLLSLLALDFPATDNMTLADIYTMKNNTEILVHDIDKPETKRFGFSA